MILKYYDHKILIKHCTTAKRPNNLANAVCLTKAFHGFTSRINSKGYHSLVPGLISIFLETVWVPLKIAYIMAGMHRHDGHANNDAFIRIGS